jgi:hypothetical protein
MEELQLVDTKLLHCCQTKFELHSTQDMKTIQLEYIRIKLRHAQ